MVLFESHKVKMLRNEIEELREENLQLLREKCELDLKLFNTYGREIEEKIADELELSPLQKSKLAFIFSIEHARLSGVPEDKILHDKDEVDAFFTARES